MRELAIGAGWGRAALNLVYPPLCVACSTWVGEPHALCGGCWGKMSFIEGPICAQCGLPFDFDPGERSLCGPCTAKPHSFARARAVFRYDEASKPLILAFKYGDRLDRTPAFVHWLERTGHGLLAEIDLIVPVPLHRWRLWQRRYNQAAILAGRLARLSGTAYDPLALRRTRATPSQGAMASAKARRRNMLGAFQVAEHRRDQVRGRNVLLMDDVFTTGATLDACARALKRAGAARVEALTLARVVRPGSVEL